MTGDDLREQIRLEIDLRDGDPVLVRWTSGGSYYRAHAAVVRVNDASIRVRLTERAGPYPLGHDIVVPRILSRDRDSMPRRWSANNCVSHRIG